MGIALSGGGADGEELLRRAGLAVYRVKERGKNGTGFFDPLMEERAVARLERLGALRKAVERNELVTHYQPIVDMETGEIQGAEALVRWNRPGHGKVAPLDFIPLAEESGLIQEIGARVLQDACASAAGWRRDGHPDTQVGVNVSARRLMEPGFEELVERTLSDCGLEPEALVLEVTESSLIQSPGVVISKLERLVDLGVRLCLDDFDEGYSSLSQIRSLPIHALKVARPFVREVGESHADRRLVRGIIELAQRDALWALGCRYGQGYLFGRPVDLRALRSLLRQAPLVSRSAGSS